MSTTTTFLVRSIGAAWQAALYDWETYIADTTASWAITMTNASPLRGIQTVITVGSDVTTRNYLMAEIPSSTGVALDHYLRSPGLRTMPKVLPALFGSRNVLTEWRAVMVPFRRSTISAALGITVRSLRQESDDHSPINYDSHADFWAARKDGMMGIDATLITIYQSDWTWVLPADEGISDGLIGGAQLSAPGAQANLAPLVLAVQDLARREFTVSMDNGDTLVHMSSGDLEV